MRRPVVSRKTLDLLVERPVAGGAMLARHEGRVVLVMGAIPGERVRVRVDRERRDVCHATTVEVLEPHADRRPVQGDPACGGQVYGHIAYPRQCALKADFVRDTLTRIAKLPHVGPIPVTPSRESGYRLRARLHLQREGLRIGFLRERSHQVCDVPATGQLSAAAAAVVSGLGIYLRQRGDRAWKAARHVDYIDVAENIAGSDRVVHFQLRRALPVATLNAWVPEDGVTGVTYRAGADARVRLVRGMPTVSDPVGLLTGEDRGEIAISRHAPVFFQSNRYLLPTLVQTVCARVDAGPVLDLYAGVGLFSLALGAPGHGAIVAVERDPDAARDLRHNIEMSSLPIRAEARTVEDYLGANGSPLQETVIVDPPRGGLSAAMVDGLATRRARRVVYVSCDVATFARDVARFGHRGYRVDDIVALDLFPNTAHVELVATLVPSTTTSGAEPPRPSS